ncbi:hypothetical protein V2W45_1373570 [Cenococcum geophilum]
MLRLIAPILRTLPAYRSRSILPSLPFFSPSPSFVEVKPKAACADGAWTRREAKRLVWSPSCINWAIDPKTGMNNTTYPDWQFLFWWRSVFFRKQEFVYKDVKSGKEVSVRGSALGRISQTAALSLLVGGWLVAAGFIDRKVIEEVAENLVGQARELI